MDTSTETAAPTETEVNLPNNWRARPYQKNLWRYLIKGGKRAIAIWHRRAGKDDVALHFTALCAIERKANYWHCLPEFEQGRRALWTAINPHTGMRRIDEAFPHEIRTHTNDQTMFIRFVNGSTWSIIGSDHYDSTMGSAPAGIVYSEWALSNPAAWGYHRPILEENNGWALFITTPRGRNHAKTMFDMASSTPGWFAEVLSVDDTDTLSQEQLAIALKEYISLFGRDVGVAQFEQEYQCNFNAAILGAYFALEMRDVRREGRVTYDCEADLSRVVHRCWDIGMDDDTAIWWFQVVGGQVFWLDVYAASNHGVDHYAQICRERADKYGWKDGYDWVPHDAKVREWGNKGRTRVTAMQAEGLNPMLSPDATKLDGIEAARRTLGISVFHPRCESPGLQALEQYQREWDTVLRAFKHVEKRNWTTHIADSFRYGSLAWRALPVVKAKEPTVKGWVIPPPDDRPPRSGIIRL